MRLTTRNAKAGMVVKLTHPLPGYTIGDRNPAVGTKYEVSGIIREIHGSTIYVSWGNGYSNSYSGGTLTCTDDLPEGNLISIWD